MDLNTSKESDPNDRRRDGGTVLILPVRQTKSEYVTTRSTVRTYCTLSTYQDF
jgi:hypothetical protein